jgi:AraC-like DNA-binding protein/mannose-6-phosphate isomerase-like protein (cupin superfamily)
MTIKGMQIVELLTDATQQELTGHGDFRFPLGIYENTMDRNVLGFVPWHWHEEIQFNYVTKGTMHFTVNSENFVLEEGQGIFVNSGCMHSIKPVNRPDSTYVCIDAAKKLFAAFKGGIIEQKYMTPFVKPAIFLDTDSGWQEDILRKLKTIFSLFKTKPFAFEVDICSELLAIWSILVKNNPLGETNEYTTSQEDCGKVKKILTYIHQHYAEKISLDDIAKIIFLSRSECCRFFKKKTNCTIFEYIMEHRINKSIELLQNDHFSVSEVASATGFSTASYFTESFRKYVGCTPKEYRKRREEKR